MSGPFLFRRPAFLLKHIMIRRIHFYPLLFIALVSCSDDKEDTSASVVGEWQGDRSEVRASYQGIPVRQETDEDFDGQIEFTESGAFIYTDDGNTTNGTYTRNGSTLTLNGSFTFEGIEFTDLSFTIDQLTETRLRLKLDRNQEIEDPTYGEITVTITGELDFNRL
jgi:hypothetical protein